MDIITHGHTTYGIHPDYADRFRPEHFEPAWWQARHAVTGQSKGRGITWFLKLEQQPLVLRHYYRGGILGKLLHDRYLYSGVQRSRAFAEFRLLEWMKHHNLPVPKPCAVRLVRNGLIYRADILLERLSNTHDLVQHLREKPLAAPQWEAVGRTIQRFHEAGILHADLNSHNILLGTDDKIWLIDFDKGKQLTDGSWKQANLERLLRSFRKELTLNPALHWQKSDWPKLLKGYGKNGSSS